MRATTIACCSLLAADVQGLLLPTTRPVRTVTPRMGLLPENSLGGKMFKTVAELFNTSGATDRKRVGRLANEVKNLPARVWLRPRALPNLHQ